jgi:hypothetical protein
MNVRYTGQALAARYPGAHRYPNRHDSVKAAFGRDAFAGTSAVAPPWAGFLGRELGAFQRLQRPVVGRGVRYNYLPLSPSDTEIPRYVGDDCHVRRTSYSRRSLRGCEVHARLPVCQYGIANCGSAPRGL